MRAWFESEFQASWTESAGEGAKAGRRLASLSATMKAQTFLEVEAAMKAWASWVGEQGKKSLMSGRPMVAVACGLMFLQPSDNPLQIMACSALGEHVLSAAKEHKFLTDQDKGVLQKAIKFVCTSPDMMSLRLSRHKVDGQKVEVILGEQASVLSLLQFSLCACACVVLWWISTLFSLFFLVQGSRREWAWSWKAAMCHWWKIY